MIFLHSNIKFRRGYKKYEVKVVHNLETFNMDIKNAFKCWLGRTKVFTSESFADYISSKDPNIIALTKEEYDLTIANANFKP